MVMTYSPAVSDLSDPSDMSDKVCGKRCGGSNAKQKTR